MIYCDYDGEEKEYEKNLNIASWIKKEKIKSPEVALVCINGREVPKEKYENVYLSDGDKITVLYFLGDS